MRSKAYSFKCKEDDENGNKIKGISKSQSKHIKYEEYKKCLDGKEYQRECNNYILRSINQEMPLQEIKKNRLYLFLMINDVLQMKLKVNHGTEN